MMLLAIDQARHAPGTLEMVMAIALFGTLVDFITDDERKPNGRYVSLILSPLSWAFAMFYRKIKGTAAPAWMPSAFAFTVYASLLFVASFFG